MGQDVGGLYIQDLAVKALACEEKVKRRKGGKVKIGLGSKKVRGGAKNCRGGAKDLSTQGLIGRATLQARATLGICSAWAVQ